MQTLFKKKIDIIQSKRTFGIEIETGYKSDDSLMALRDDKLFRSNFRTKSDSSIKVNNGFEIVSGILKGKEGAKAVAGLCAKAKELKMVEGHESCGLHVHVGAGDFQEKKEIIFVENENLSSAVRDNKGFITSASKIPTDFLKGVYKDNILDSNNKIDKNKLVNIVKQFYTSNCADRNEFVPFFQVENLTVSSFNTSTQVGGEDFNYRFFGWLYEDDFAIQRGLERKRNRVMRELEGSPLNDGVKENLTKQQRKAWARVLKCDSPSWILEIESNKVTEKLKSLLYFYTLFDDVFLDMLPLSRREKNLYSIPISSSFDLESIKAVKTHSEFQKMWYKLSDDDSIKRHTGIQYNDSRYYNVNLHSIWNRTGTIEFRGMGSTFDPNQVLLWTALNQHIVDKISKGDITMETMASVSQKDDVDNKFEALSRIAGLPKELNNYMARMINHFGTPKKLLIETK